MYQEQNYSGQEPRPQDHLVSPALTNRRNLSRPPSLIPMLVTVTAISLVVSTASLVFGFFAFMNNNPESQILSQTNDGNSKTFDKGSIEEVANKVAPSVVSIVATTKSSNYYGGNYSSQSAGTGVIVSKDGYILTNKHVIESTSSLSIITDSGDIYDDVKIIGSDPLNDIAFLKINGLPNGVELPHATLGDSKTISIGQSVIAIGNALGQYQNTVTSGIISGTGRTITAATSNGSSSETLSDLIQTDTAINPGNSGGPLVNAAGEVIGINTAIATESQGIGFAIPIGAVKGMLNGVLADGKVERPYVGVQYLAITPEVAKTYNLKLNNELIKKGAYIKSDRGSAIVAGGPAAKAGLQDGDIVTKINGVEIGPKGSIGTLTAEYRAGTEVKMTVIRGGKELVLTVILGVYGR
jgi:Trypsin-like serine proteases, typically periplasmic, contain C-terminal PDZ domain